MSLEGPSLPSETSASRRLSRSSGPSPRGNCASRSSWATKGKERTVRVLRRTCVADEGDRRRLQSLTQREHKSGFPDSGFPGDQDDLPGSSFRPSPARQHQVEFLPAPDKRRHMSAAQRLEPALGSALADDPPGRRRRCVTLERQRAEPDQFEEVSHQASRAVGDDDGAGFGDLLQPGGEVGRFPGHRLLLCGALAKKIPHHDETGRDPDPRRQRRPAGGHLAYRRDHGETRPDGSLRRVLARPRPAEIRQDAVTEELRDMPFEPGNLPHNRVLVRPHDVAEFLGIEPATEIHRNRQDRRT